MSPVDGFSVDIINIRSQDETSLKEEIAHHLISNSPVSAVQEKGFPDIQWTKSLPDIVRYEGQGIDLYEAITRDSQYYLHEEELSLFQQYGDEIATALLDRQSVKVDLDEWSDGNSNRYVTPEIHVTVVDLGAGRMDKATCLLKSVAKLTSQADGTTKDKATSGTYFAACIELAEQLLNITKLELQIDIQYNELHRRLANLLQENPMFVNGCHQDEAEYGVGKIAVRGICGSYLDAFRVLSDGGLVQHAQALRFEGCKAIQGKCILWLGSSLSNLSPPDVAAFLRRFAIDDVLNPGDTLLIGLDRCRDVQKVKAAYSEQSESWKEFVRNGVRNAGLILGGDATSKLDGSSNWEYIGRWNAVDGKHMRFVQSKKHVSFDIALNSSTGVVSKLHVFIEPGEHIFMGQTYKYTAAEVDGYFRSAGLLVLKEWTAPQNSCSLYLLEKDIVSK